MKGHMVYQVIVPAVDAVQDDARLSHVPERDVGYVYQIELRAPTRSGVIVADPGAPPLQGDVHEDKARRPFVVVVVVSNDEVNIV
jgi:hypothetical protein